MTTAMKKILAIFALAALVLAAFVFWKTTKKETETELLSESEYIRTADGEKAVSDGERNNIREFAVERRLKRLEVGMAMKGASGAAGGSGANPIEEERLKQEEEERQRIMNDPAARKAKVAEIYSETMQQFQQQEYDADWAGPAEAGFRQDFTAISTNIGARLQNVECRTNGCIAKMEFNNYEHAKENIDELAARPYSVNCKRRVVTPEPDDVDAPYQVTLFFRECEKGEASL